MQAATQDSVVAIKEISGTIGRVSEIAAAIAAAIEQQGAATQEIARNVQQAALGSTQVATSIADVNRGAGDTGTASSQVLSSAQMLSNENKRLKAEVVKFLATVRAAYGFPRGDSLARRPSRIRARWAGSRHGLSPRHRCHLLCVR